MTIIDPPDRDAPPPPRITRIAVTKLFGAYNHDVVLKYEDRVTIVYGINGVGKTKLLELTAALTRGQVWALIDVSFEKLRIEYDDGTATEAHRAAPQAGVRPSKATPRAAPKRARVRSRLTGLEIRRINIVGEKVLANWSPKSIDERAEEVGLPPWYEPVDDGIWMDTRTQRLRTEQELMRMHGIPPRRERHGIPSDKLAELIPCLPAHLIETQRLFRVPSRRAQLDSPEYDTSLVMTVEGLAVELRQNIAGIQTEFARITQGLDRTLTERVLQAEMSPESLGENLRLRLEALDAHRERLERVGLLDDGSFGPTLPPAAASALSGDRAIMIAIHTEDTEKKFQVLDPLATRLELLLDGMNDKLAAPKTLLLDRERTLSIQRRTETIALDQLSSGEQHQLVLLYDLTFRIRPSTLVLIDEPELSLHPAWQQQFLGDILKIAANGAFDVVIATHSPYVIGDRSDLCVELKSDDQE